MSDKHVCPECREYLEWKAEFVAAIHGLYTMSEDELRKVYRENCSDRKYTGDDVIVLRAIMIAEMVEEFVARPCVLHKAVTGAMMKAAVEGNVIPVSLRAETAGHQTRGVN